METINYPPFIVDGKKIGYILTEESAKKRHIDNLFVVTPYYKLHLSCKLRLDDLVKITKYPHPFDYALPQSWFNKHYEETQHTHYVWVLTPEHQIFGEPIALYNQLRAQVGQMINRQFWMAIQKLGVGDKDV